ncbi:transcriptional regulator CtsR [Clostridium pasteurianum DSM 525 = ATCC 6013]|uniref:Transcriptional regulator CtsR n=1 Tax=Clostridium pasteurianum DSM 525 = ATCC 6013 TaxID=1262449 RepID=A0A0H3J928_CLOPA|nr:CtsR family transcriptional regulator [Clostridium pasteurianum]AJA49762.1 transcriptional regulator CtsR [Clostridium pasteurianum DSM 525 = ATCC 6013]AJA53750.1 transcriptional regulator CtsR [Clostridium pasteurianum DSM 525 = ATCC 6013]AOZ76912.1 CtsR family transcriptional regulator [Clostridium pasteurianum DSM 525 = ATCC 6013]AOZ80709.1 CtsR family transcriptional regulator [Clostridium pasteurianum]ELP57547.1 transcriptional repressor CtsR [Clostridium pasteurianum DSM 525 = ATCC 60
MIRLSDIIESFIKEMMAEADKNELEIQRNELANQFSCAPSQINYVLTTRFTTEKGYYIESKRGGGGCIRIKKIEYIENKPLADVIIEKIGNNITYSKGVQIIEALKDADIISNREVNILKLAINDRTLSIVNDLRNKVRAEILKATIVAIML